MFLNATEQTTWLPQQASTIASEVDALFYFIYYWTLIFLAIVGFCVFYFGWKYRSSKHSKPLKFVAIGIIINAIAYFSYIL